MVKMVLAASQTQASSVSSKSTATVQAYENLIQSLQLFVSEEQLKSMAYDNAKSYYSSVLIPFVKASILLTEAVAEACQKFTDTYQAEVDSCDLDSEVLERQINEAQVQINRLEAIWRENSLKDIPDNIKGNQLFQNGQTMERIFNMKTMLQDKLNKLLQFEASSPQLFANISNLKAIVEKSKAQTAGAWNGSSFTLPADLSWTGTVGASWQLRDKRLKGIDDQKVEQLKEYTIYAVVYYDLDGNPKVMWQLEKDGKGLMNPELYQYLDKAGVYLDPDMFEFMDYDSWNAKIKDGWRNGYNYVTGETYNPLLGGLVTGSQYVEDVYTWINETDIGIALQTLGFTYATYRMATQNGSVTVDKKASGAGNVDDISWSLNKNGATINGRKYSGHALERMAPDTPDIRAQLHTRAQEIAKSKGYVPGTREYSDFIKKYVQPRNVPPSVIEDAITNGVKTAGNQINTWKFETGDVTVIINDLGDVITVIPK
jgi:hypothetical protein